MGENSKIEWTHHTFNPWRGCTKVSEGCANCYAEQLSKRNPSVLGIWGPNGTRVIASESMWREPIKWDKEAGKAGERHRVFCASLADVFEDRPELVEPRHRMLDLVRRTKHLDWLLLTKRPENALPMLCDFSKRRMGIWSAFHLFMEHELPNVWLGTSVENQEQADKRIPELLKVPAAVRFLSCEPLLGPVDLNEFLRCPDCGYTQRDVAEHLDHHLCCGPGPRLSWIIAGGESGPNARPMHPDWVRSLRDQCQAAGVPFFFKQWGDWQNGSTPNHEPASVNGVVLNNGRYCIPDTLQGRRTIERELNGQWDRFHPTAMARVGKKAAGRLLDGRTWDEFPRVNSDCTARP